MPVCAECSTENPDVAKFCLACGSPLAAPAPVEEERKLDTLLFVDMVGSTSRAEKLDPEDVLALLEPYYRRLRAELIRFGGTVEKYIGDAVVAHFGVPVAHEDDPERAVRAGFAVLEAIKTLNEEDPTRELEVRVGIATGETIVTLGARVEEGKGISWGDILNTAARIQGAAPVNGILVGERTYLASRDAIEYVEREPIIAKGKEKPVPVYEAVRIKDTVRHSSDAPLVGRTAELDLLLGTWRRSVDERRAFVTTLVGDAGIGKSRLVAELAAAAEGEAAIHWGSCLSYGEGITYWPVAEIVKEAAGILQTDPQEAVAAKLGAWIESLNVDDLDQLRTIAAALSNLVGVAATPRGTYSSAEISQAELHWGIRRTFELLASERPQVLVFDDLHWAEPTLVELIEYLVGDEVAEPLLIVGSGRRELRERAPSLLRSGEHRAAIELSVLDEEASQLLLDELLGVQEVPEVYASALLRAAGGNPLFLEETVRMLADGNLLGGDEEPGALPVPTSLQSLIGSRLDSLPVPEKRAAQQASVAGSVFWSGALARLNDEQAPLDQELEGLERRDVVRGHEVSTVAEEREWAFKHILMRDVAYSRVPKWRRAGLHVRFADWVAELPAQEEFVEILAHHLEQACRLAREVGRSEVTPPVDRAVEALVRAGEKAERREGTREADRFYERALDLLEPGDDRALELRFCRARLVSALADHRAAEEALGPIAAEARTHGLDKLRATALVALANVELKQGKAAQARDHLDEATATATQIGDDRLRVRATFELAQLHSWFDGDTAGAVAELKSTCDVADRDLAIGAHLRLGTALFNLGEFAEAEIALRRSIALSSELGSIRDEARGVFLLGLILFYREGADVAEREHLRAEEWFARTGDIYLHIQNLRGLAKCSLWRGDHAAAEEQLKLALPSAVEAGGWLVVEIYRYLFEAVLAQGRLDDALQLLALARTAVPAADQYARAALLLVEARAAEAVGELEAMEAAYGEALRLLAEQELHADLAEAQLAYARATGSADALNRAREAFARIGANAFLAEIDLDLASASA